MEKISGILPSSHRMRPTTQDSGTVRPGAPRFGRPEGASALAEPKPSVVMPSSIDMLRDIGELPMTKEERIATDVADNFFMQKPMKPVLQENQVFVVEPYEMNFEFDQFSSPVLVAEGSSEPQDSPEYIRNGQYLDVVV